MEPTRTAGIAQIATNEAITTLQDLLTWELPPDRWDSVTRILDQVGEALDSGDIGALSVATAELERARPRRIIRVGSGTEPAPKPVREYATRLIHHLDRPNRAAPKGSAGTPKPGGDHDPRRG